MSALPLLRARRNQCRWFVGDAWAGTVCGAAVRLGSSYCPAHHALVYQPGTALTLKPARDNAVRAVDPEAERTEDLVELLA